MAEDFRDLVLDVLVRVDFLVEYLRRDGLASCSKVEWLVTLGDGVHFDSCNSGDV